MKKLLLSAMALFMSVVVSNAQTTTRLEVAGDWTKLKQKAETNSINSIMDLKDVGLRASFGAEYHLGRSVYIYSGLNYKLENSRTTEDLLPKDILPSIANMFLPVGGILQQENTSTMHYLSIPVNLGARIKFGPVGISAEVGPYFSYGIKGQITSAIQSELFKSDYLNKLTKEEQEALNLLKNKYGSSYDPFKSNEAKSEPAYKRIDFGVGAGLAVEFSIFYLRVGSDFGLYNLSNIKDFDIKKHNIYAGLGLRF